MSTGRHQVVSVVLDKGKEQWGVCRTGKQTNEKLRILCDSIKGVVPVTTKTIREMCRTRKKGKTRTNR